MTSNFTIGKLAEAANVPATTIRYYERSGLLSASGRTRGNYRIFHHDALERVLFIRAAQKHGFSLDDIRQLLELRDDASNACQEVQDLIQARLADITERAKQLMRVEAELHSLQQICIESENTGKCRVIGNLADQAVQSAKG